jgi:hypothetical protein
MKTYGGVDAYIHVSLASALVGGEWSASQPSCFTSRERAQGILRIRGWRCGKEKILDPTRTQTLTPWSGESKYFLKNSKTGHFTGRVFTTQAWEENSIGLDVCISLCECCDYNDIININKIIMTVVMIFIIALSVIHACPSSVSLNN